MTLPRPTIPLSSALIDPDADDHDDTRPIVGVTIAVLAGAVLYAGFVWWWLS